MYNVYNILIWALVREKFTVKRICLTEKKAIERQFQDINFCILPKM